MNKWILFFFLSFVLASVAHAAGTSGEGSTDTAPLRTTPDLCDCSIRADANVSAGEGSDQSTRGAPIKQRAAEALGDKSTPTGDSPKVVKDGGNGEG